MNAPEPGTVKEFFAKEEETVTVGQDLVVLELGGPPKGGEKQQASQEPKAPAPADQQSSSEPKSETKANESSQDSKAEVSSLPSPPRDEQPPKAPPKDKGNSSSGPDESSSEAKKPVRQGSKTETSSTSSNRGERRVSPDYRLAEQAFT